ncbi:MAG: tetratricopeptide repeat protein [Alphaproteobacteria bacterium]|nr:tetratricopeptide repeat protein [Alphaproteobacteria bacterium]MCB9797831.1 tetratricopeptide repeat protein [Alphaproteobacteria bacterium]
MTTKYDKRRTARKNKGRDDYKHALDEKVLRWQVDWESDDVEVIQNGDHVDVYAEIDESGQATPEQQELASRVQPTTPSEVAFHEATQVMLRGDHQEALELFASVAGRWPEKRAAALLSMGACSFWLKRYDEAIEFYTQAGEAGAPEEMVAANIAEAEEAKAKG